MCFTVQLSRFVASQQLFALYHFVSVLSTTFSSFFQFFFEVLSSRWRPEHFIMFSVSCQPLFSIFRKQFELFIYLRQFIWRLDKDTTSNRQCQQVFTCFFVNFANRDYAQRTHKLSQVYRPFYYSFFIFI